MNLKIIFLLFFLFLFSCKKTIQESDIPYLAGYWEIEKVILPDGEEKVYKSNETIDYFILNGKSGFRKKGLQQFNGTFLTNNITETFTIQWINNSCKLHYKTKFSKWEEEIIRLSEEKLVVKNNNDLEYHYKRPTLFTKK